MSLYHLTLATPLPISPLTSHIKINYTITYTFPPLRAPLSNHSHSDSVPHHILTPCMMLSLLLGTQSIMPFPSTFYLTTPSSFRSPLVTIISPSMTISYFGPAATPTTTPTIPTDPNSIHQVWCLFVVGRSHLIKLSSMQDTTLPSRCSMWMIYFGLDAEQHLVQWQIAPETGSNLRRWPCALNTSLSSAEQMEAAPLEWATMSPSHS